MSKYAYRPCGAMHGIAVTQNELSRFAKRIGREFIDEYIPLPNADRAKQEACATGAATCPARCDDDPAPDANPTEGWEYWETDKGDHGWCCGTCGKVHQWG